MPCPSWSYYPRNVRPPQWVNDLVAAANSIQDSIDSTRDADPDHDRKSDAILVRLRPGLELLGYQVETGKSRPQKISRPVLFANDGKAEVSYEIDAVHDGLGISVEVEAGRGAANGADYRDIVRTALLLDAEYLALFHAAQVSVQTGGKGTEQASLPQHAASA